MFFIISLVLIAKIKLPSNWINVVLKEEIIFGSYCNLLENLGTLFP
jgi:hypothetical protein